eukprot:511759_1
MNRKMVDSPIKANVHKMMPRMIVNRFPLRFLPPTMRQCCVLWSAQSVTNTCDVMSCTNAWAITAEENFTQPGTNWTACATVNGKNSILHAKIRSHRLHVTIQHFGAQSVGQYRLKMQSGREIVDSGPISSIKNTVVEGIDFSVHTNILNIDPRTRTNVALFISIFS